MVSKALLFLIRARCLTCSNKIIITSRSLQVLGAEFSRLDRPHVDVFTGARLQDRVQSDVAISPFVSHGVGP